MKHIQFELVRDAKSETGWYLVCREGPEPGWDWDRHEEPPYLPDHTHVHDGHAFPATPEGLKDLLLQLIAQEAAE